ncbi:MAG: hypothetical protein CMP37_02045 [Rickettsiales bacterium]|nr:hypothetical protein [Rickettsiales bacterium]
MGIKFLLFLPFLEIVFFILFGDVLGFLNTIIIIIITGLCGLRLLFPSNKLESIKEIGAEPLNWLCNRLAGIFLLIPGFLTDIIGFMLLIKPLRLIIWKFVPENIKNFTDSSYSSKESKRDSRKDKIIDADYKDLDDQ